jgi:hypothetical protein
MDTQFWQLLASAPKSGAFYGMKSDFVKGQKQLLEPLIVVHNKTDHSDRYEGA